MISIRCPSCSATLTVPESAAGRKGTCPKCGDKVQVPTNVLAGAGPSPRPAGDLGFGPADDGPEFDPFAPPAPKVRAQPGPPRSFAGGDPPDLRRVVVVDFDMPMGSMVRLMVKMTIASIPAIILSIGIFLFLSFVLGVLLVMVGVDPNQFKN